MTVKDILLELYGSVTPFHVALATSLLLLYFVYLFLKENDLPPGPTGLPVVGCWPFIKGDTIHIQLKDMVAKYGDVYCFRALGKLFIHLGSIKAIKEAHVTKSEFFGERCTNFSALKFLFKDGIFFIVGEPWKALRKFFLTKFKEYGMYAVKENVAGPIDDALKQTVEEMHNLKGEPFAITDLASSKCLPILRRILFNDQGITVEEVEEMIQQFKIVLGGLNDTFLLTGNLAKYLIFPFAPRRWRMWSANNRIKAILLDVIKRHERNFDETQVVDIIDCFIKEKEDRRKKGDPSANYFTDKALAASLNQIITDSIETVGLFIGIFLMSLVEHPEEQEKIYQELMDVIGSDRMPTMEDKSKLPLTSAFMYEVMRMTDLFPIYPSLECTQETTLQGHKIPKGSLLVVNVYAAQYNPDTYDDPETFNPSRYLPTSDGKRAELPVMFGVGKRSCIGEGYAMTQAFLFVTTIVKNFRLSFPEGTKSVSNILFTDEKLLIRAVPRC